MLESITPSALDRELLLVLGCVVALMSTLTVVAFVLERRGKTEATRSTAANLKARTGSYWVLILVLTVSILAGLPGALLLFALVSALALREYLGIAAPAASDRRVVLAVYLFFLPFQYVLIGIQWYGLFAIFIPVYAFLFVPTANALTGNPERFLERTATVQWGLMVCIYCISYAPALLVLQIPGFEGENAKLLVWFVLVVQLSDFLQYASGKLVGRRPIAPTISPNKTWEGFGLGILGATLIGGAMWWLTPYPPLGALAMALVATLMGFAGGLTMSAIKRDHGVKDFGEILPGHGGILDRVDSICFSAPLVFHITRYLFSVGP